MRTEGFWKKLAPCPPVHETTKAEPKNSRPIFRPISAPESTHEPLTSLAWVLSGDVAHLADAKKLKELTALQFTRHLQASNLYLSISPTPNDIASRSFPDRLIPNLQDLISHTQTPLHPSTMADQVQEMLDVPREFLKDGIQFINRAQKRTSFFCYVS